MYSERSQVKFVRWSYVQDPNRSLQTTAVLGRITTSVALPVTSKTAGQYACTLYLENGDSVQYMHTVTKIGEKEVHAVTLSVSFFTSCYLFLVVNPLRSRQPH